MPAQRKPKHVEDMTREELQAELAQGVNDTRRRLHIQRELEILEAVDAEQQAEADAVAAAQAEEQRKEDAIDEHKAILAAARKHAGHYKALPTTPLAECALVVARIGAGHVSLREQIKSYLATVGVKIDDSRYDRAHWPLAFTHTNKFLVKVVKDSGLATLSPHFTVVPPGGEFCDSIDEALALDLARFEECLPRPDAEPTKPRVQDGPSYPEIVNAMHEDALRGQRQRADAELGKAARAERENKERQNDRARNVRQIERDAQGNVI